MSIDLGERMDRLNALFLQAETKLESLGLGVTARIPLPDVGFSPHFLRFGKYENKWRLLVEFDTDSIQSRVTPLVNESRRVRVKAALLLPVLEAELRRQCAEETVEVDKAIMAVSGYLCRVIPVAENEL